MAIDNLHSPAHLLLGICHVGLFEDCDDCDAPSSGVTMFFSNSRELLEHDLVP